jgi:molecular chaperone GrpE
MAKRRDEDTDTEELSEPGSRAATEATGDESLEQLRHERNDYLARWQRAAADYKNLRRRTGEDVEAAVRRTMTPLLENLLLVLDHLDMALTTPVESKDASALAQGVRLTRDQFLKGLQGEGVETIPDEGLFDPDLHEAVATVETDEVEPGTVVETVRRGFTWRGIVLRHSHVKVARSPEAGSGIDLESSDAGGSAEE